MKKILFPILFLFSVSAFAQTTETLFVGPELIKCGGMIEQMCMPVRSDTSKAYEPYGGPIDGFTYEEGYVYELQVEKENYKDVQGFKYILKNVISKTIPVVTVYVANRKVDCEDTKIFSCILYREGNDKEWHNLYGKINGFKYKAGYEYELLVFKKLNQNSGAGRTYTYNLIRVVSQEPTMVISKKNREAVEGKKFVLSGFSNGGKFEKTDAYPKVFIKFNLYENSIGGNDGCNQMSAKIALNNSNIKIGPVLSTQMFCTDVTIDKTIHALFEKIDKYKVSGGSVKFYQGKTLLLEYTAVTEDTPQPQK